MLTVNIPARNLRINYTKSLTKHSRPRNDGVNAITPEYEIQFHNDEDFLEFAKTVAHILQKYHQQYRAPEVHHIAVE